MDTAGNPMVDTIVRFTVTDGPNAGVIGGGATDANGQVSFTYADDGGSGIDSIQANVGTVLSNVVQATWTGAGSLDHIAIAPASATIAAGDSQAYTATGFDRFNNNIGDVTAGTTFSISPNGSCSGNACTASAPGPHTITGSNGTMTATASLTVTPGALDHITVSPASATIAAGGNQTYSAAGFDRFNNSLGDVTAATTFSIAPNGSCTGATCTATVAGTHTVTGNNGGRTATATLVVTGGGNTCGITINPATLRQPYLALPYLELLSAQPSGSYVFSVSAGALPPGLQLVTAFGVSSIAGIPTKPGTYSFTIKAKKVNSACEATRSHTLTVAATVVPILQCVSRNANRTYTARFGYDNSTAAVVSIPVGSANYFAPGAQNRGQVTVFQPGRVNNAFSVTFAANGSDLGIWFLRGPDGQLRPLTVTTVSLSCQ